MCVDMHAYLNIATISLVMDYKLRVLNVMLNVTFITSFCISDPSGVDSGWIGPSMNDCCARWNTCIQVNVMCKASARRHEL